MTNTNSLHLAGGNKVLLNRYVNVTPTYNPPADFVVGVDSTTPLRSATDVTNRIPIDDGTINDDGDNTLTGSDAGVNSTDNTTTFKEGASTTDDTAQNLIKDDSDTVAMWTISNLASAGVVINITEYAGFWFYIKDATAYAKLRTADWCLQIRLGSDASNLYTKTWNYDDLTTGWNWLPLGIVGSMTQSGTPTGTIDYFALRMITNNTTDEFAAGDIIYDMLRQWEIADTVKALDSSIHYESNEEIVFEAKLTTTDCVGFLLDSICVFNDDSTPIACSLDVMDENSKSADDVFIYTITER